MATTIRPIRVNHMNVVLEDFDAGLRHFEDLYGAEFLNDIPQPELHAGLFETGRVIFEMFVPRAYLLLARYGPHYLGLEYQADMAVVRQAIAERGIRIIRDIGVAVHTHPEDTFGVAFEFYGDYFHDRPAWKQTGRPMRSAAFWRDEHPLGLTGLKGYTLAVRDIRAASEFIQGFLGGEPVYEAPRDAIAGRAVGLQVADAVVELVTPTAEGVLERHLNRYGEGIRSTVFGVRDVEQARSYFAGRGVQLADGGAPGAFAVPAEANQGVIFEFAE